MANTRTTCTPEETAAAVLKNVRWSGALPVDPIKIAACYGVSVTYDESLMRGTESGYCVNHEGKVTIIVNPADPTVRQRFTIAHELGHAFLHGIGVHARSSTSYDVLRKKEAEANRFAAALLMPAQIVLQAMELNKSLGEMANIFQVSEAAMTVRLKSLRLL